MMKTSKMNESEREPLLESNNNTQFSLNPKKNFDLKWFIVIVSVTIICILGFTFHKSIGNYITQDYDFDSTSDDWHEIEHVDLDHVSKEWSWKEACSGSEKITLTVAIKQTNTDSLGEKLLEVSDPKSSKYGQHWTYEQIHDFLKPSDESISSVYSWLEFHGISEENIEKITPNSDFISFTCDISTANKMLNTEFGRWSHATSEQTHIRVRDNYFVAKSVSSHIDFISPTLRFPIKSHTRSMELISDNSLFKAKTSTYNTPSRLKSLYDVTVTGGQSSENSQTVASFLTEWFNDDDLEKFWDTFEISTSEVTRHPETQPEGYGSEAELDVQYITAMGEGIHTLVWDVEDDLYFISLLQQLEESSVTTSVVSMSYGGDEQSNGYSYCNRANNEFAKVGLLGVTFFASSGDDGAVSSSSESCDTEGEYTPSFPASSPYVTAVGGVYGGDANGVETNTDEFGWYYSGGGFSTFFDSQDWQKSAISSYLSSGVTLPSSSRYHSSGRAYPDVAAQSVSYIICYELSFYSVSGTSCSCPTVAGMIALINDYRLAKGLTRLGWLNPLIYSLYADNKDYYYNDVTTGYNMGCDTDGIAFYTATGWDPVTGVGSLKFSRLFDRLVTAGTSSDVEENPTKKKHSTKN